MTEIYKLARPLLRGAPIEILSGEPQGVKNLMIRDILGGLMQFKGEIVVGNPVDPNCYERSQEFVDDEHEIAPFVFWVYDIRTTDSYPLNDRLKIAEPMITACGPAVQFVDHELITTSEELQSYITKVVRDNFFAGIVLREPYGTFGTYDEAIPAESLKLQ